MLFRYREMYRLSTTEILREKVAQMKKKRKKSGMLFVGIIGLLILIIVLLVVLIKEKSSNDNYSDNSEITAKEEFIDYEAFEIKEYEYPAEFSMGENLKTAITQLALCYDSFDKDSVYSAEWKEMFIARFIQNSRVSFDYLDMVSDNNNGEISIDELNYMQYSLTGIELDFTSCVNGTVNRYDDSSTLNYGWISDWDYEYTDDGVTVTVNFEVGTDGTDVTQERELTVNLVKNPYSCFDGYSVAAITSKVITSSFEQVEGVHVFYGTDMMEEDSGVFPFEFLYSEDNLHYGHFVYVDMTKLPELADFVRQNAGSDFKVTYTLDVEETDTIENVVPIDITLDDNESEKKGDIIGL